MSVNLKDNDDLKLTVAVSRHDLDALTKSVEALHKDHAALHRDYADMKVFLTKLDNKVDVLQRTKWGAGIIGLVLAISTFVYAELTYSPKEIQNEITALTTQVSHLSDKVELEAEKHNYLEKEVENIYNKDQHHYG